MSEDRLRFGLIPPEGVTTAWGARLIWSEIEDDPPGAPLRIVWDRQDAIGERRRDLCDRLNANESRIMVQAADRARDLMRSAELESRDDKRVVLYDDGTLRIEADPRRSAGYLYVCAYFIPD